MSASSGARPGLQRVLVEFAQTLEEFRVPELVASGEVVGVNVVYNQAEADLVSSRVPEKMTPFMNIYVPSEADVIEIGKRSVLVKGFWQVLAEAKTYPQLEAAINTIPETIMEPFYGSTFSFKVHAFGKHYTQEFQRELLHKTSNMPLWDRSTVNLKNPTFKFALLENVGIANAARNVEEAPNYIYLARKICSASRHLVDKYSLKKRVYLGTTSMAAELSLIIANLAHAGPNSLVYDPFVGTGSLPVACANFGAHCLGADISPPVLRGTVPGKNPVANMAQYGLQHLLVDLITCDNSLPPMLQRPFLDAIICDPPYGVRAGAKKIGKKNTDESTEKPVRPGDSTHVPQCIAYSVPDVLRDLLELAAKTLVINGRLTYWLPTTYNFVREDLPKHPSLVLVSTSLQPLTVKWGRCLIVMEKIKDYIPLPKTTPGEASPFSNFAKIVMEDVYRRDDGDLGQRDMAELHRQQEAHRASKQERRQAKRQEITRLKKTLPHSACTAINATTPSSPQSQSNEQQHNNP
ncbi:tRNA guanosine-2'-O-methyltransferase 11 [Pelomyxa schiedti]|nr:tRNA guanosine-2'-O-methyltransferase 11 [Pelomyxa schiedti]